MPCPVRNHGVLRGVVEPIVNRPVQPRRVGTGERANMAAIRVEFPGLLHLPAVHCEQGAPECCCDAACIFMMKHPQQLRIVNMPSGQTGHQRIAPPENIIRLINQIGIRDLDSGIRVQMPDKIRFLPPLSGIEGIALQYELPGCRRDEQRLLHDPVLRRRGAKQSAQPEPVQHPLQLAVRQGA